MAQRYCENNTLQNRKLLCCLIIAQERRGWVVEMLAAFINERFLPSLKFLPSSALDERVCTSETENIQQHIMGNSIRNFLLNVIKSSPFSHEPIHVSARHSSVEKHVTSG